MNLRTITLSGTELPEPMREAPEVEEVYWLVALFAGGARLIKWKDDNNDWLWLRMGLCHKTKEAAEQWLEWWKNNVAGEER